jgi:type 2 lantibiotic biosynthesis protein LanM
MYSADTARVTQTMDRIHRASRRIRESSGPELMALLDQWQEKAAGPDPQAFSELLRRDGIPHEQSRTEEPESWTEMLCEISDEAQRQAGTHAAPGDIPFEQILRPAAAVAARRLDRLAGSAMRLLSSEARASVERMLLRRLSLYAAPCLLEDFDRERPAGARMASRWLGPAQSAAPAELYQRFAEAHLNDGLLRLLEEWPALARIVVTVCTVWIEAGAEFLTRLETDLPLLAAAFGTPWSDACVTELSLAESDPHNGGRTVAVLRFANGTGLVYKPRDTGAEAAFHEFAEWCNANGAPERISAPRVLRRPGYGWVERVEPAPLDGEAAARRYYTRAGALMATLHLLGGTDGHHENVIAWGEYPALIDAETLLTPNAPALSQTSPAAERLSLSALRTGMLPVRIGGNSENLNYDVSVFGSGSGSLPAVPRWRDVNTDAMQLVPETAAFVFDHLPVLDGRPLTARNYPSEIERGFAGMYGWFASHRIHLLQSAALAAFRGIASRFIFRPTAVYSMLLHSATTPDRLRHGHLVSLELEGLARAYLAPGAPAEWWPMFAAERGAMENLDVPVFHVRSDATTVAANGANVRFFPRSGLDELIHRIEALDAGVVDTETRVVHGALAANRTGSAMKLTPADLVSIAAGIAADIAGLAIEDDRGGVDWLGMSAVDAEGNLALAPVGPALYDGGAGIAVFLAAVDYVRGTAVYRNLALRALRTAFRQSMQDRSLPVGAATGVASVVYGLVRGAQLLNAPDLIGEARELARTITPDRIEADSEHDVLSGAAGAILGLLALHEVSPERDFLESATAAGRKLSAGPESWTARGARTLTGMSHGAAGIAYALLRLYDATGNSRFLQSALLGIEYENRHFLEKENNWPDFRPAAEDHAGARMSWCHGAPGIGLARLGGIRYFSNATVRRDIEAAIVSTRANCFGPVDHPCCGVFGRIETLLAAGLELNQPALHEEAFDHAARAIARGLQTGHIAPDFAPGFFRGQSGIGYQLLRIASPGRVPSVLLWR